MISPVTPPPSPAKPKPKRPYLTLHFWAFYTHLILGLTLGIYFTVIAFSGSMIIFSDWLDAWRNPSLFYVTPTGQPHPFSKVLAALKEAHPKARLLSASPPGASNRAWIFLADLPISDPHAASITYEESDIFIDPYSLKALGHRNNHDAQSFLHFFEKLHFDLLLDRNPGRTINGYLAIPTLLVLASGLILWWPKKLKSLYQRLTIKFTAGFNRFNWDTHSALGIWALPILLIAVLTGIYFPFNGKIRPYIKHYIGERGDSIKLPLPPHDPSLPPPTLDQILANVAATLPNAYITNISGFNSSSPNISVRQPIAGIHYACKLNIDSDTGHIDSINSPNSAADWIIQSILPLHSGYVLFPFMRVVYFLVGLTPLILLLTGGWIFIHRQINKRKKAKHRPTNATSIPTPSPFRKELG